MRLSSGVYHLNDSFTDRPQLSAVLALDGLTDVALIGKLAQTGYTQSSIDQSTTTLLVHGLRGAVWMHNCTRVRFHSLDFDMARLPYTYGRAIRATDLSTTIEFDPKLYSFESRAQQPWQLRVTNVNEFDPMDWRLNGTGQYNSATAPVPVTLDRPGQLTLHGVGMMQGVRVGKHYILRNTCELSLPQRLQNNCSSPNYSAVASNLRHVHGTSSFKQTVCQYKTIYYATAWFRRLWYFRHFVRPQLWYRIRAGEDVERSRHGLCL